MRKRTIISVVALFFFGAFQLASLAGAGQETNSNKKVLDPLGIARLKSNTQGDARISISEATGGARFIRFSGSLKGLANAATVQDKSSAFIGEYGSIFGIKNALTDLKLAQKKSDFLGGKHFSYQQLYFGVPIFAGVLKTHFDASGNLRAVNGNIIPEINVNPQPSIKSQAAAATALNKIAKDRGSETSLSVRSTNLFVYRTGLAQGVAGENHLVWQVEVGNGSNVREFVYIDAHTGKFVDQITGVVDDLSRRAYDGENLPNVPPSYPDSPFWVEGEPFPTGVTEADNMITSSKETYDFYFNSFARDSFDASGAKMDSIFNRGYGCPNASWNGTFISFCPGFTTDDVTGHEWTHAYTQYTHGLIYQWQPGALNESYSDMFGETIDRINGRDGIGNSLTDPARTGNCSSFSPPVAQFIINSPAGIAGTYPAQGALFGPPLSATGVTGNVVLAVDSDGTADPNDACGAITNGSAISGKIALINRGTCNFSLKVYNAQLVGAVAVVITNNVSSGLPGMGAGVNADLVTIPSVGITQADGDKLKANISVPPNVTMRSSAGATDESTRWLVGEDITPGGAIRDMYNPTCYSNPGKVNDTAYYTCATGDNGGVHTNSGVPNHAYALLVDGGTYNGQTINAIGLIKTAHIYFRAMSVYQHPTTDFSDHADAIETAATDLIGVDLPDLTTGDPSGQKITAADVAEVHKATLAVELRNPPTFCNFQPLLAKNPPALCFDVSGSPTSLFEDDFEAGLDNWTLTNTGAFSGWPNVDWAQSTTLPGGRSGAAAFAIDLNTGNCDGGAGDTSGVMHMDSGAITLPASNNISARVAFEHYVATEFGFDGGNLKVSVNGGPFSLVPRTAYHFNPYNTTLQPTDPLAPQAAFSGTDGGQVTGSWGQSQVNLLAAGTGVRPGDTVRLRYDMGMDGCGAVDGWYVDDVQAYTCSVQPPDCSGAFASPNKLAKPNHKFRPITVLGVTDPDGDAISITIDSIFQDEAVLAPGSGKTSPDGQGIGTSTAQVRNERIEGGDGRVYHIGFTGRARNGLGGICTGQVTVSIPYGDNPVVDEGALYDSTQP